MAQHKRPTEVSLAPTQETSALHEWVQRYWMGALAVLLAGAGVVIWRVQSANAAQAAAQASWDRLRSAVELDNPRFGLQQADLDALESAATDLQGSEAGAWALALAAQKRLDRRDFAGAQSALDRLRAGYPDHELVTRSYVFGEGLASVSIVEHLENSITAQRSLRERAPQLFTNPPVPEDAPRVRLTTSKGVIVVALYHQIAPKHSENFLKLVREGFYVGTRFHRVVEGQMVQGGDPNSADPNAVETWGLGGPEYELEPEPSGLKHFRGVLSTAKKGGAAMESGSQFFLTTGDVHSWDGQYTVFGTVVEGQHVLDLLDSAAIAEGSADRPVDPAVVEATEVL